MAEILPEWTPLGSRERGARGVLERITAISGNNGGEKNAFAEDARRWAKKTTRGRQRSMCSPEFSVSQAAAPHFCGGALLFSD
jgi:hypothetical protein